jgi:hypothetical protein
MQTFCVTIPRTLRIEATTVTQMKFYKVRAVVTLIYGSES